MILLTRTEIDVTGNSSLWIFDSAAFILCFRRLHSLLPPPSFESAVLFCFRARCFADAMHDFHITVSYLPEQVMVWSQRLYSFIQEYRQDAGKKSKTILNRYHQIHISWTLDGTMKLEKNANMNYRLWYIRNTGSWREHVFFLSEKTCDKRKTCLRIQRNRKNFSLTQERSLWMRWIFLHISNKVLGGINQFSDLRVLPSHLLYRSMFRILFSCVAVKLAWKWPVLRKLKDIRRQTS